ncbi:maleylpyruvate isomerase family mycothiol-dependent enzyme [Actinokineospora inagensis]|uniref:maleylpyruvate isomerase family mycothiol-dependent enzyme n=1 Tax=Actinokineospora inagensis TaxID=103730 RepID=UPI000418766D|nr:maleylpyruvate isomerase family mycothiol-dependent enzyme [Actinokineospora inagensis]
MLTDADLRAEIVTQTALLTSTIADADLRTPVPSCPGWTVGMLLRHIGHGHRWAAEILTTRTTEPLADAALRDLTGYTDEDPAVLSPWLTEGAHLLHDALAATPASTPLWSPIPGGNAGFYARRFTHETLIHRADATLALHRPFTVTAPVAIDAIDEWMALTTLPAILDFYPERKTLLHHPKSISYSATDAPISWQVDFSGPVFRYTTHTTPATATVSAPLTLLLLDLYRRLADPLPATGDQSLVSAWRTHSTFG